MPFALFLGCTVPVRNLNYEIAARRIGQRLGLDLRDNPEMACCGFPLKSLSVDRALAMAARNLAVAARDGLDIAAICSACAASLAEAEHTLAHDPELAERINRDLAPMGLTYRPGVRVRHMTRLLIEDVGLDAIRQAVTRPLTGFRFAPHYGCHNLKPSAVMDRFDDPDNPRTLADLIAALGAEPVDYKGITDCCGGGLLGVDENLAMGMAGNKLGVLQDAEVDGLVVICPFCNVMFEGQQKAIAKKMGRDLKVPVVFYPQLLGLALGLAPDELGFKLNRIKNKAFLAAMEA